MSFENDSILLPAYQTFMDIISVLDLPSSASELHGIICGFLCAGETAKVEAYLQSLTPNKKDESFRAAALALFEVYSISHHQLAHFDLNFQLLLPADEESMTDRAQAFCEWCEGFTEAMSMAGIHNLTQFKDEESQEAFQHIAKFSELDYEALDIDESDEKALMEVTEYTRMAVLRLYSDLLDGEHHSPKGNHFH